VIQYCPIPCQYVSSRPMKVRKAKNSANRKRRAEQVAPVADIQTQLDEARALIKALTDRITQLENELAEARKNSSTSSKPPSSDIVKPKKPRRKDGKKRKRGGQPGHPRHERPKCPPEMVNEFFSYTLESCPDCGAELRFSRKADPRIVQQAELIDTPLYITEHKMLAYWCPHCRKIHYAPIPETVAKTGLFGPRLTTLVAFMKGVCHASFSTIRKFLRDVAGVQVSRGYLAKLIRKVSDWLTPAISPLTGQYRSLAALTDSMTPHSAPRSNVSPTRGSSTKVMSPSASWA